MFPDDLLRRGLVPALAALLALAGAALAGPAEDCRNRDLEDPDRLGPCTEAIEAATDPMDRADLLLWRGAIHRRAGDVAKAGADFDAAEALRPDWADPHVERAWLLHGQDDVDGAVAAVRRGLEAEPGSLYAASELLEFLAEDGRWQACLDAAPRALELGPDDSVTFARRGRCLAESGRHEAAVADYRRALELGLQEAYLQSNLAWSLVELGRLDEAVAAARAALALDPEEPNAPRHLVRALALAEGRDAALGALEGTRSDPAVRMALANDVAWDLLVRDGRAAESLSLAEAAVRTGAEPTALVWDTYAHALAATGRPEDAVRAFLRAMAADPARQVAYAGRLAGLGFPADPADPAGMKAALRACAATGAACRLAD